MLMSWVVFSSLAGSIDVHLQAFYPELYCKAMQFNPSYKVFFSSSLHFIAVELLVLLVIRQR